MNEYKPWRIVRILGYTIVAGAHLFLLGGSYGAEGEEENVSRALAMVKGEVAPADSKWALDVLRKGAEAAIPSAYTGLAFCHQRAFGIEYDKGKTRHYLEMAAEAGDAEGMCELGLFYYYGWRGEKNEDHALELYRESIAKGYLSAKARLLQTRLPFYPDPNPESEIKTSLDELVRLAEVENNGLAAYMLAVYYRGSDAFYSRFPEVREKARKFQRQDLVEKYLRLAVDLGFDPAMKIMGERALVSKKPVEAARYFRMGHLRNNPWCSVGLAGVLRKNATARTDDDPHWYNLLLDLHDRKFPDASYELGLTLNHARGYSGRWLDWRRATECLESYLNYELAHGDFFTEKAGAAAHRIMRMCYEGGHAQPRDLKKVIEYGWRSVCHDPFSAKMVGLSLLHPQSVHDSDRETLVNAYACVLYYQLQGGDRGEGGMRGTALESLRALHGFTQDEVARAEEIAKEGEFPFVTSLFEGFKE